MPSLSFQAERKQEATQETIIDQQQTIEKFRELVRNLQEDMRELREKGTKSTSGGGDSMAQSQTMMSLNVQLKSTMKAHARVGTTSVPVVLCIGRQPCIGVITIGVCLCVTLIHVILYM